MEKVEESQVDHWRDKKDDCSVLVVEDRVWNKVEVEGEGVYPPAGEGRRLVNVTLEDGVVSTRKDSEVSTETFIVLHEQGDANWDWGETDFINHKVGHVSGLQGEEERGKGQVAGPTVENSALEHRHWVCSCKATDKEDMHVWPVADRPTTKPVQMTKTRVQGFRVKVRDLGVNDVSETGGPFVGRVAEVDWRWSHYTKREEGPALNSERTIIVYDSDHS